MKLAALNDFKGKLKLLAIVVGIILILKGIIYFTESEDKKEPFFDFGQILRNLMAKQANLQAENEKRQNVEKGINAFNNFIGFLYANPTKSGKALDDIKDKFFSSRTCNWRSNWHQNIPDGMSRPAASANKAAAQTDYQTWVQCVLDNEPKCVNKLNEFNKRFFTDCIVVLPIDRSKIQTQYIGDLFPGIQ